MLTKLLANAAAVVWSPLRLPCVTNLLHVIEPSHWPAIAARWNVFPGVQKSGGSISRWSGTSERYFWSWNRIFSVWAHILRKFIRNCRLYEFRGKHELIINKQVIIVDINSFCCLKLRRESNPTKILRDPQNQWKGTHFASLNIIGDVRKWAVVHLLYRAAAIAAAVSEVSRSQSSSGRKAIFPECHPKKCPRYESGATGNKTGSASQFKRHTNIVRLAVNAILSKTLDGRWAVIIWHLHCMWWNSNTPHKSINTLHLNYTLNIKKVVYSTEGSLIKVFCSCASLLEMRTQGVMQGNDVFIAVLRKHRNIYGA